MRLCWLLGLAVLSLSCGGARQMPHTPEPLPTDGIRVAGAVRGFYGLDPPGRCVFAAFGLEGVQGLSFGTRSSSANESLHTVPNQSLGFVIAPYSGPGRYTVRQVAGPGAMVSLSGLGDHAFVATSGVIIVRPSDSPSTLSGTLEAPEMPDVDAGAWGRVSAHGTWTCHLGPAPPMPSGLTTAVSPPPRVPPTGPPTVVIKPGP